MTLRQRLVLVLAGTLLGPAALDAQGGFDPQVEEYAGPVRWELGLTGLLADPVGEFDDYVGLGGGFNLFGVFYLGESLRWGLRLDGTLIVYGSNTVRRPLSPTVPFVDVDVKTENTIASFALGPHVVFGDGWIRPYLHASVGASQFATTTSVYGSGSSDFQPFASTDNFEDYTFRLEVGGGLRLDLATARRHPLMLELGADYVRHGLTDYLREGGIRELPGGGYEVDPIRSETNLMTYHLALVIGIR
ncbi:MAG TPA: hypothetical protein VLA09_01605 [Longimicrobiales bacterium]|nr:hypothetical protein [Longimicrobiales bacterium]